jgi:DNA-binding Lrp family transcriptional regulator
VSEASTDKVKRPASQYYWGDWFKDLALQSCCLTARGLWHEMNCLMHQGEPYGHLTMPNGKPMGPVQLANLCKISAAQCKKLIEELEENGVFSRRADGAIYSRRMVRDEAVRQARAAGGAAGAEHGMKGAEAGKKGGRPKGEEGGSETPLAGAGKPPPSSSSSSASSSSEGMGANAPLSAPTPTPRPAPTPKKSRSAKAPKSMEGLPTWMSGLIDLWHEVLPELPGVVVMSTERETILRDFREWVMTTKRPDGTPRATNEAELLAWTRAFLERARASDFIMGRGHKPPEHKNWRCTIEYLLSARGIQKVTEQTEVPA